MYWQKRFERLKDAQMGLADDEVKVLRKEYARSLLKLKKDINDWYVRYAKENNLTYAEAKRILNKRERSEFQMTLDEYIKEAKKKDLAPAHLQMLKNASIRVRLDRAQEIYIKMAQEVEKLAKANDMRLDAFLREVYKDTAYKTAYETQRITGWTPFREIPERAIEEVVRKPWAADGEDFSSRIWENKQKLLQTLESELSHSLIAGVGTTQIAERVTRRMNISFNTARRLVETETAYIEERAMLDTYEELDVEKFQILATLDTKTSEICRTMDGKIFNKKDAKPGVTMPPFHCYCRSTTVPYLGELEGEARAARDKDGKTVFVDGGLTYEKWRELYGEKYSKGLKERPNKYVVAKIMAGEYGTKINQEKQKSHIEASAEKGKSYLFNSINPQELFNKYAGTGIMELNRKGEYTNKELCKANMDIGIDGVSGLKTKLFKIHHSKQRTHIVPFKEKNK